MTIKDLKPFPNKCPLLGIDLCYTNHEHKFNSPSIDRIVPELGYVPGNVWIISYKANSMKQNANLDELQSLTINLKYKIMEGKAHYTFQHVAQEMIDLQDKKNSDYGNAYFNNLEDEGIAAARIAVGNKWHRFKHLSIEDISKVNESLEDTLIDMAAYALMTVQWMRNKKTQCA